MQQVSNDTPVSGKIDLAPGQTLLGRYEIIERIGHGRTGVVFRARDIARRNDIALKVIFPRLLTKRGVRERFMAEVEAASELYHPGVVKPNGVHTVGPYCFLTMELLKGQSLRQLMKVRKQARRPFSRKEVIHIVNSLVDTLDYAHLRTVHRNLKPENIWVDRGKNYRIMDFGSASLLPTDRPTPGSPTNYAYNYIAPEQLKGWNNVDRNADQYALGVIMYELLNRQISAKRINAVRRRFKTVNHNISSVIARMLAVDPAARFDSILQVKEALSQTESSSQNLLSSRKFRAFVATLVLGLCIATLVASRDNLAAFWESVRPLSVQEKQLMFDEVIKRVNDVNRLNRELIKARRDLDASLNKLQDDIRQLNADLSKARYDTAKDALQEQIDEALVDLARQQRLKSFTDRVVFTDNSLQGLETSVQQTLALLDQEYHWRALGLIKPIQVELTRRMQQFDNAEKYLVVRARLAAAQTEWEEYNLASKLQAPADLEQRLQDIANAQQQAEEGELAGALEQLEQFTRQFQRDHMLDRQRVAERAGYRAQLDKTRALEQAWQRYLQRNGFEIGAAQSETLAQLEGREQAQTLAQEFSAAEDTSRLRAQTVQAYFVAAKDAVRESNRKLAAENERKARERAEKALAEAQKAAASASKNIAQAPAGSSGNASADSSSSQSLSRLLAKHAPGLELVDIPAGKFRMGDLNRAGDRDEKPVREVNVKAFKLSKHEITFEQYDHYAAISGRQKPDDAGWGRGKRPLINVDWNEANAYAEWLSAATGLNFRLPSEAEWEYAARAGSTTKFPWGNSASHAQANYGHDVCCRGLAAEADQWVNTAPAGSFPANPFGIHDMQGNVVEWTLDCWNDSYNQAAGDARAMLRGDCNKRVVRGGSWSSVPDYIRSANRSGTRFGKRANYLGFRLVLEP